MFISDRRPLKCKKWFQVDQNAARSVIRSNNYCWFCHTVSLIASQFLDKLSTPIKRATAQQNQQKDMCTQRRLKISLGNHPVWSESSLSARRNIGSSATHRAHCEDSDQTGQMLRLIRVFTGRTDHFIVFVIKRPQISNILKHLITDKQTEGFTRRVIPVWPQYLSKSHDIWISSIQIFWYLWQADLRLCCLHMAKTGFLRHGSNF